MSFELCERIDHLEKLLEFRCNDVDKLRAELVAANLVIKQMREALQSCGYANDSTDSEMCGSYYDSEKVFKAIFLKPSSEALAERDRKRDAALLDIVSTRLHDEKQNWVLVAQWAVARKSGEWEPNLEVK